MKDTERRTGEENDKKTAENQGENTEREPMKEAEKNTEIHMPVRKSMSVPLPMPFRLLRESGRCIFLFWLWKKKYSVTVS